MKRRIGILYLSKTLDINRCTSSHYPTIRSVINILLEDPENEITLLTRNKVLPSLGFKINAIPLSKYDGMYLEKDVYDEGLKSFLAQHTYLDFDVLLMFGELGLGDYAIHHKRYSDETVPHFNAKYYNSFRSTLQFVYTPLRILDFLTFKRIYFVGQDKDFICKYPQYENAENYEKTYFVDFNDDSVTMDRTFGGFIPELMAYDFLEPMNWVGVSQVKTKLFSAGYHINENRTAFVNSWLSKINHPEYDFHLKRANKRIQAACSHPNDKGVLKFPDMVKKIAQSRYSLVIGTVNNPNTKRAFTIRQHMNWALGTHTFFLNDYDPEKVLIGSDLDFFRISEPDELMDKIDALEQDPSRRDSLLHEITDQYLSKERFQAMKQRWHELIDQGARS